LQLQHPFISCSNKVTENKRASRRSKTSGSARNSLPIFALAPSLLKSPARPHSTTLHSADPSCRDPNKSVRAELVLPADSSRHIPGLFSHSSSYLVPLRVLNPSSHSPPSLPRRLPAQKSDSVLCLDKPSLAGYIDCHKQTSSW